MREVGAAPVVVVGAGPVGLSLALGLGRCGVRTLLLERREQLSEHSKAPGVHVRTREVLSAWGLGEALLREGRLVPRLQLHRDLAGRRSPLLALDLALLSDEAEAAGVLVLEQDRLEKLLLDAVRGSGTCDVRFGAEVMTVQVQGSRVRVGYREGGRTLGVEAPFVVGCDGAGSVVREQVGLGFEGLTYALRAMLADVVVDDARDALLWPQVRLRRGSLSFALQLRPRHWRVVTLQRRQSEATTDPDDAQVGDAEIGEAVEALLGPGPVRTLWSSRFRLHRRSAARFRSGPVLLAGDAAHVHSPVGGQGMNSGIHDAANLAWKLAGALGGGDTGRLLDSYDVERRSVVVGGTSRYTDLVTRAFLLTPTPVSAAAFALLRLVLRLPAARRASARRAAMLDLRYRRSPLLPPRDRAAGRRLPDPVLHAPSGAQVRLHSLLGYRPSLVVVTSDQDQDPDPDPAPGTGLPVDVVHVGPAGYDDRAGVLRRLIGGGSGWLLVRPDAHVALAGRTSAAGPTARQLAHALGNPGPAPG